MSAVDDYKRLSLELLTARQGGLSDEAEDSYLERLDVIWDLLTEAEVKAMRAWTAKVVAEHE